LSVLPHSTFSVQILNKLYCTNILYLQ